MLSLLLLLAAIPTVARADSKKFVAHFHGDAFDAAAAAAAQSANPTIAKMRVKESGLMPDDNSLPNRVSAVRSDSSPAAIHSAFPAPANAADETPESYGFAGNGLGFNQVARQDSSASQWAASFYGGGGFTFYPGVAEGARSSGEALNGSSSARIDLGFGHAGETGVNSSGSGIRHNKVAPRTKWPLRVLTGQPVAAPEPSSLLLLGCGVIAVGLKRRYLSAK